MSNNIGTNATLSKTRSRWVQTERASHEAWAKLVAKRPRAAQMLHHLVAHMGRNNAVVISQNTLAKIMGVHVRTVQRASRDLVDGNWIQIVRIGRGREAAYCVNSRVAWGQPRSELNLATFTAMVIADYDEQDNSELPHPEHAKLRNIPTLYPNERQLPGGEHETPPTQPALQGMEMDLPAKLDRPD